MSLTKIKIGNKSIIGNTWSVFNLIVQQMRSLRNIYSLNFVVKCEVDMTRGSSWFMDVAGQLRKRVTLTSLRLKIISSLQVCSGPQAALLWQTPGSRVFIASKRRISDRRVSDNIFPSPEWRSKVLNVQRKCFPKSYPMKYIKIIDSVTYLLISSMHNWFPHSICDNIDNRGQYSIEFLILGQIFV